MKIEFYHVDAFELPNYEPIWRKLREKGVEANLVAVPGDLNTAAAGWFDFEKFKTYCVERNIPYVTKIDPNADLAVTTQNAAILKEYACPRVRLMYGPMMYPLVWGFQAQSVTPFDAILTHGKSYQTYFSKWLRTEQLPIVGYARFDEFFSQQLQRETIRARWGVTDNRPVLVFLPTWGDNTAFEKFFPTLAKLTQDYHVLLRPHHCTLRFESERVSMMHSSRLPILENAFDLAEVFAAADVICADVRSSGLLEACMCNIPAIGMVKDPAEVSGWLAQCTLGQMVNLCSDPSELEMLISMAIHSKLQSINRLGWIDDQVAYRNGTAAEHSANALIELVRRHARKNIISSILTPVYLR